MATAINNFDISCIRYVKTDIEKTGQQNVRRTQNSNSNFIKAKSNALLMQKYCSFPRAFDGYSVVAQQIRIVHQFLQLDKSRISQTNVPFRNRFGQTFLELIGARFYNFTRVDDASFLIYEAEFHVEVKWPSE